MIWRFTMAFAVSLLVAAGPKEEMISLISEPLAGEWTFTYLVMDGLAITGEDAGRCKLKCLGNRMKLIIDDKDLFECLYSLDTSKSPKSIDMTLLIDGYFSEEWHGFYSRKVDHLAIYWGEERPKAFPIVPKDKRAIEPFWILQRRQN